MAYSQDLWFISRPRRILLVVVDPDTERNLYDIRSKVVTAFYGSKEMVVGRLIYWKLNEPCSYLDMPLLDKELEKIATRLTLNSLIAPFLIAEGVTPKAHIIIEHVPRPTVEEEQREQDDAAANLRRSFEDLICMAEFGKTPSVAAESGEYRGSQAGDDTAPLLHDCRYDDNVPTYTVAPAIQLFNPAFAHFSANAFNPNFDVPDEAIRETVVFMEKFSAIYSSKRFREEVIDNLLEDLLDSPICIVHTGDRTPPDGGITATSSVGREVAYLALIADETEIGDGNSDPSTQAGFLYTRTITRHGAEIAHFCCHPTFLIAQAGPWLVILGAVFTDRFIIQRLTDFIWIPVRSCHDNDQYLRIARILYALRNALKTLDTWYTTTLATVPRYNPKQRPSTPHPRFFPTPASYRDANNQVISFVYQQAMQPATYCVTYLAEARQGRKVIVKFVNRYGAEAHRELAKAGYAPELLYHGAVDPSNPSLYGDLQMVVMEFIDGTLASDIQSDKLPESFMTDLRCAVTLLHSKGFVFGDLRPPNVMISTDKKVKLIDFDWAGKEGEVRYPVALSGGIFWPKGVKGLELIEKWHDLEMMHESRWT